MLSNIKVQRKFFKVTFSTQ